MLDSHTLVSNAVGAVCFAAAYTVSKTLSRAEAFSDDDEEDGDWSDYYGSTTDDTDLNSTSSFRDTPAPTPIDPETLFRLRTHLSQTHHIPQPSHHLPQQELQAEHSTQTLHSRIRIPAPPLRLPFQELQGDLPLYFDPTTRNWTWLEPFPLDNPEEEARLGREAALRRAHWRTSTPPRPRALVGKVGVMGREEKMGKVDVVWTREEGTTTFVRYDASGGGGGGVLMRVEMPEGEYFPLVDVQGLPFFGLGPPSADATRLTTRGWVPVPVPLPDADAAPPLTPSPSNNRKRKGVHFDDIPYIKIVDRIEYKVPRTRTDGDVCAALRRVRCALEELEDIILVPEEEEDVQVEDPFAFTYEGERQERVNARDGQEQPHAREAQEQANAREVQDPANGYEDQERVDARREHEQEQANAHAQHADFYTPTKPTPAAAPAIRAPLQLLTPSSLERPAPHRVPPDAHRGPSASHRVPSEAHRATSAYHRASSAPPEFYSPTPAPPALHPSTPALFDLREDSPTPATRRINGRHVNLVE